MNFAVSILDTEGRFNSITINGELLVELTERLRKEGTVDVHTVTENGNTKTYKAQAIVVTGRGLKGSMMFIPTE